MSGSQPSRTWRRVQKQSFDLQEIWRKVTDADSWWSIAAACVIALLLSCGILAHFRPSIVLQKDAQGKLQGPGGETHISIVKLLAWSFGSALAVGAVCVFVKYKLKRQ